MEVVGKKRTNNANKSAYYAMADDALSLFEAKKKKSLRKRIGLPIGSSLLFHQEPFVGDAGTTEMIDFATKVQEIIKRRGDNDEVFDIEEDDDKNFVAYIKSASGEIKPSNFGFIDAKHLEKERQNKKMQILKSDTKFWESEFWKDHDITSVVAEIVNPKNVEISNIQQHEDLNSKFWNGEELKPEVRLVILKNAVAFLKNLSLPDLRIEDIVLTGSLANYNYTEESDLDIHILLDFKKIDDNVDLVKEFFLAKKSEWNEDKDITIYGHEVETMVEDTNENNHWSAAYSVLKNDWIRKPLKKMIELNKHEIQMKASGFMNSIEKLEKIEDAEKGANLIDKLRSKLHKMRSSGLRKEGEFSVENLTYKVLRSTGYIDKLKQLKNKFINNDLSL